MDRELAWLLAHHWQEAGDAVRAIDYLLLAAERAQEAMGEDEAMDLFGRAHELATDDATRTRILLLPGPGPGATGGFRSRPPRAGGPDSPPRGGGPAPGAPGTGPGQPVDRADSAGHRGGRASLEMAERLGAQEFIGPAMGRLSQGYGMRGADGDLDLALELGDRALEMWVPGSMQGELPEHDYMQAHVHYWTGGYGRAMELSLAAKHEAVHPTSGEALLRGGGWRGLCSSRWDATRRRSRASTR